MVAEVAEVMGAAAAAMRVARVEVAVGEADTVPATAAEVAAVEARRVAMCRRPRPARRLWGLT